jgi:peptidoglycan-associated lipoprotein
MKQNLYLKKYVFVTIMCLGLGACSTSHHKPMNGNGNSYDEESIQSSGLGSERGFGDSGKGNALRAPYNQIYYFNFDDSSVHEEDRESIEVQARYLVAHRNARIRIEGNTDSRGSREYNVALGEHRAMSVAEILKLNGVAANQIKVVSYGAEKTVAFGDTEEDYQLNRRAELVYEKK